MIKVMSFNIRMGLANDGINHWQYRKSLTLQRIQTFKPDLLGIQECWDDENQAGFLKQRLFDYEFYGVQRGGQSGAAKEMSPALFKRSRFKCLERGAFWLSETPSCVGSQDWDSAFPRTCLWFRLLHRKTQRQLIFLNTHFDYQPIALVKSAKVLKQWLKQNADTPLIVTGDFNADKHSETYRVLKTQLRDAHPTDDNTFHDYGQIQAGCPIDWLWMSSHFVVKHSAIDHYHQGAVYPSDHYPLLVRLDWKS